MTAWPPVGNRTATLDQRSPFASDGGEPASHPLERPVEVIMGSCNPGLKETRLLTVQECHTASSTGSGDVEVLGTPTLLGLAEQACVAAIADDLEAGQTSVGSWAEIEHLRPVAVGTEVCAQATLRGHHGARLEFVVLIRAEDDIVAKVRHRRVLVDRERFVAKIDSLARTDVA